MLSDACRQKNTKTKTKNKLTNKQKTLHLSCQGLWDLSVFSIFISPILSTCESFRIHNEESSWTKLFHLGYASFISRYSQTNKPISLSLQKALLVFQKLHRIPSVSIVGVRQRFFMEFHTDTIDHFVSNKMI